MTTQMIIAQCLMVLTLVIMITGMTPIYITAITGAAISAIVAGFPLAGSAPMTIAKMINSGLNPVIADMTGIPTLAADSGFFQLEARIHRTSQNFKIYVGVATTFVSGKCSFLLKAEGASTRLRASKLNSVDIRSNKPAS